MASVVTAVTLVSTLEAAVTTPTSPTTATVLPAAVKGLKATPKTKPKLAVPSTSTDVTVTATGKTCSPNKIH